MTLLAVLTLLACTPGATLETAWTGDPTGSTDGGEPTDGADSGDPTDGTDSTDGAEPEPPAPPALTVAAPPVWDPIDGGALGFEIEADAAGELELTLFDQGGAKLMTESLALKAGVPLALSWDGEDAYSTGTYTLEALFVESESGLAMEAASEREIRAVRAAVSAAWAEDDNGETALRVPLYWHLSRTLQDFGYPLSALDSLEDADGAPLDLPGVTDSLDIHLGEEMNEPSAWRWDSRPILSLLVGGETTLGGTNLDGAGVQLRVEGWTVLEDGPLAPGEHVVIQKDEPLADFLGVIEEPLVLAFVAPDPDGGEDWLVAEQQLPLTLYAVHDAPSFDDEGDVYHPWVAAIDASLRAIDGVEPQVEPVLDALVEWVFSDLGLTYDTRRGASAYTTYRNDWTNGHFFMSDFLGRRFGDVVNCSDCASILAAYANMLGARLSYLIILENFDLNEILAIGQDDYTSCPFGPNSCGFSYHAVTTTDGGERIWDATLALDGDEDPGGAPWELLPVQGVDGEEYLDRLVRDGDAAYYYETIGSLQ